MDNENYISDGYVIWARKTIESEIFYEKPAIWFKIWFYLIVRVNHRNNKLFDRGSAIISYNQIIQATNASKGQVDKCFRWLKLVDMVCTHRSTRGMLVTILNYNKYQDQKHYSVETKSTAGRNKVDTINKNERSKNVIIKNKEKEYTSEFNQFWLSYPNKIGKRYAFECWERIKKPPIEEVVKSVEKQKKSIKWKKENGQYIPNPATWLNQGRWEDELEEKPQPTEAMLDGRPF